MGHDKQGDNLAVYSNGKWCFRCGYRESEDRVQRHKRVLLSSSKDPPKVALPEDVTNELPQEAKDWLTQYEISKADIYKNNIVFSPTYNRLIFPIFGEDSSLIAWQGRYIPIGVQVKTAPKWFSQGDLNTVFHIIGHGSDLILCEDIVSAIKLGNVTRAMPIFGCSISVPRWKHLKLLGNSNVKVWLDPDMRIKTVKECRKGQVVGVNASSIFSTRDPKEHSYTEIHKILVDKSK